MAAVGIVVVREMALLGIRSIVIYFLAGGLILITVNASEIHPTVTGVILGLMTPIGNWVNDKRSHAILDKVVAYPPGDHWSGDTEDRKALGMAEAAARETLAPVERLGWILHPWVAFEIMPLFCICQRRGADIFRRS